MTTSIELSPWKRFSEGFRISRPPQRYTIPQLNGIQGRYVRIRPSVTGDGYLSISQIQVIDLNKNNVALNTQVFATSSGGKPVDQRYGKNVDYGGVFEYVPGVSADPSVIVDGNISPRWGLTNIFETANENTNDKEYVEIDLSNNVMITKVIYTGRADPIQKTFIDYYGNVNVDQVTRLTGMRLEILNEAKVVVHTETFNDNLQTHVSEIPINNTNFIVNSTGGSTGLQSVNLPNLAAYKEISTQFEKTYDLANANADLIRAVNTNYTYVNTAYSSTTLQYTFDISGGLFQVLASDNPIGFYNDIYAVGCPALNCKANANKPSSRAPQTLVTYQGTQQPDINNYDITLSSLVPNLSISIFGTNVPSGSIAEMTESIELCKAIFLGAPQYIENYIAVKYPILAGSEDGAASNFQVYSAASRLDVSLMKPYIRTSGQKRWCMPYIRQVFTNGAFAAKISDKSRWWNESKGPAGFDDSNAIAYCNRELTPAMLGLIPYSARNFIIEWIRDRQIRYIRYYNTVPQNAGRQINEDMPRIVVPPPGIDIYSGVVLDSIAQQFYEYLGGQFSMSYIYDVLPLGTTILDVRFSLRIHTDAATSHKSIDDLKAQYRNFVGNSTKVTQTMVDQAQNDYETNLNTLQQNNILTNASNAFDGAVIRIFYTRTTAGGFRVDGIIFDAKAVTSFIPELNCGLSVPIGSQDGNVNYAPTVTYTMNEDLVKLDCKDPATIRDIIDDYVSMVQVNKDILLNAEFGPKINTSKGTLVVTKVLGSVQVSPMQCAIDWLETIYDPATNKPMNTVSGAAGSSIDIRRRGLLSYYVDTTTWFSQDPVFADLSGFKLYDPSQPIPACQFDPVTYNALLGNRFSGQGAITSPTVQANIKNDFLSTQFNNGKGPICPQTIPLYTINDTDYRAANSISAATSVIDDFKTKLLGTTSPSVKAPFNITALTTPITYTKPLPDEFKLANASGLCPAATCDDLDILYKLVTDYNANPALAGTILNVSRAYTAGANQCDIEAQVNYDSMIQDIVSVASVNPNTGLPIQVYPMIKKGTATYDTVKVRVTDGSRKTTVGSMVTGSKAVPLTGVQTVTIALYVDIDKNSCSYYLIDAGEANSGYTIQSNTPVLYKPLNYVVELQNRGMTTLGSSMTKIQSDFSTISGSAKKTLTDYRINTYAAVGNINRLSCGQTCDSLQTPLKAAYNTSPSQLFTISSILKIGTYDANHCDYTVRDTTYKLQGLRIRVNSDCTYNSAIAIAANPTYTDVQNVGSPFTTAVVSGFTNYANPSTEEAYPLKPRDFGLDRARNSTDNFKEIQFTTPLKQEIPISDEQNNTKTYKFIRFVPLKTRDPDAYSVAVHRFTFFYQGRPLAIEGSATNPMGTWEGDMATVTGPHATGWIDLHKKPLVFAFKAPIMIDAYSLTTDIGIAASDPVAWKLEASSNGTFWTLLDSQARFSTPIGRGKDTDIIYIG